MAEIESTERLARCLACGGKIKLDAGQATANCPICGLTVLSLRGIGNLPPVVIPRRGREDCWEALTLGLRLPRAEEATRIREARLLLLPFWRWTEESTRSLSRRGIVLSAADLTPAGVPCLTRDDQSARGLAVEAFTRAGDLMGRLEADPGRIEAEAVDPMIPPDGMILEQVLGAVPEGIRAPGWRLIYYPIWSFRYAVWDKEWMHAVDAVTGRPCGGARRVRWGVVAAIASGGTALVFLAALPLLGAAAVLPAWLAGAVAMRAAILRQRR